MVSMHKSVRGEYKTAFFCLWIFCAEISTTANENPVKMTTQVQFSGSITCYLKN